MANRTLFESFSSLGKEQEPLNDDVSAVESILEHLRNILNTRQGSVLIADSYGMPDLTNFPGDDLATAVAELEKIMKITIERYEPRLSKVKISYNPDMSDALTLHFCLSAEIFTRYGENRQPIFFETIITSDGIVEVDR